MNCFENECNTDNSNAVVKLPVQQHHGAKEVQKDLERVLGKGSKKELKSEFVTKVQQVQNQVDTAQNTGHDPVMEILDRIDEATHDFEYRSSCAAFVDALRSEVTYLEGVEKPLRSLLAAIQSDSDAAWNTARHSITALEPNTKVYVIMEQLIAAMHDQLTAVQSDDTLAPRDPELVAKDIIRDIQEGTVDATLYDALPTDTLYASFPRFVNALDEGLSSAYTRWTYRYTARDTYAALNASQPRIDSTRVLLQTTQLLYRVSASTAYTTMCTSGERKDELVAANIVPMIQCLAQSSAILEPVMLSATMRSMFAALFSCIRGSAFQAGLQWTMQLVSEHQCGIQFMDELALCLSYAPDPSCVLSAIGCVAVADASVLAPHRDAIARALHRCPTMLLPCEWIVIALVRQSPTYILPFRWALERSMARHPEQQEAVFRVLLAASRYAGYQTPSIRRVVESVLFYTVQAPASVRGEAVAPLCSVLSKLSAVAPQRTVRRCLYVLQRLQ